MCICVQGVTPGSSKEELVWAVQHHFQYQEVSRLITCVSATCPWLGVCLHQASSCRTCRSQLVDPVLMHPIPSRLLAAPPQLLLLMRPLLCPRLCGWCAGCGRGQPAVWPGFCVEEGVFFRQQHGLIQLRDTPAVPGHCGSRAAPC